MNVTINTDASFSNVNGKKYGGFACWIVCDLFTLKKSGPLKDPENPHEAEAKAIANALYLLTKRLPEQPIRTLYINTDSLHTINKIEKRKKHKVIRFINDAIDELKLEEVVLKHVRAHTHTNTPRHYVNDWCDKMAKIEMRKQRDL